MGDPRRRALTLPGPSFVGSAVVQTVYMVSLRASWVAKGLVVSRLNASILFVIVFKFPGGSLL